MDAASFTDVAADSWYYDSVAYVYEKGLMDGVDVELQPRQAQMLQLPEKGSDLSSHSPFLRFPDFPVTAGQYAAAAR